MLTTIGNPLVGGSQIIESLVVFQPVRCHNATHHWGLPSPSHPLRLG
jgi:hypothetical protein